jgi:hypothetical protein
MGEERNTYKILVGKPEGKRPLTNQDIVVWIFRETGWAFSDRFHMAQCKDQWWALVNMVTQRVCNVFSYL